MAPSRRSSIAARSKNETHTDDGSVGGGSIASAASRASARSMGSRASRASFGSRHRRKGAFRDATASSLARGGPCTDAPPPKTCMPNLPKGLPRSFSTFKDKITMGSKDVNATEATKGNSNSHEGGLLSPEANNWKAARDSGMMGLNERCGKNRRSTFGGRSTFDGESIGGNSVVDMTPPRTRSATKKAKEDGSKCDGLKGRNIMEQLNELEDEDKKSGDVSDISDDESAGGANDEALGLMMDFTPPTKKHRDNALRKQRAEEWEKEELRKKKIRKAHDAGTISFGGSLGGGGSANDASTPQKAHNQRKKRAKLTGSGQNDDEQLQFEQQQHLQQMQMQQGSLTEEKLEEMLKKATTSSNQEVANHLQQFQAFLAAQNNNDYSKEKEEFIKELTELRFQNQSLKDEVQRKENEKKKLKERRNETQSKLDQVMKENKDKTDELQEAHKSLEELTQTVDNTKKELEVISAEKQGLQDQLQNLSESEQDQVKKLSAELTNAEAKNSELQEELAQKEKSYKEEVSKLGQEIECQNKDHTEKLGQLEEQLNEMQQERDAATQEKVTLQSEAMERDARIRSLEKKMECMHSPSVARTAKQEALEEARIMREAIEHQDQQKIESMQQEVTAAKNEADAINQKLEEVQHELETVQQQLDGEIGEKENIEKQMQKQKEEMDLVMAEMERVSRQLENTSKDLEAVRLSSSNDLAEAQREKEILLSQLESSKEELGCKNEQVEQLSAEVESLRAELGQAREELSAKSDEIESKTKEGTQLQAQIDSLNQDHDTLQAELEAQLKETNLQLTQSKEQNINHTGTIADLQSQLSQSQADNESITESKRKSDDKLNELTNELQVLTTHLQTARERISTLEAQIQSQADYFANFKSIEQKLLDEKYVLNEIRRKLHNRVMQLSGNMRVYVRVRPEIEEEASLLKTGGDMEMDKENVKNNSCKNSSKRTSIAPALSRPSSRSSSRGTSRPSSAASQRNEGKKKGHKNECPFKFFDVADRSMKQVHADTDAKSSSFDDITKQSIELVEPYKDRGGLSERRKTWTYGFDRVFHPRNDQEDVWAAAEPLVQSAVDGFAVCMFAYGQTGSGKTHTMIGDSQNPGLIPRAVQKLFSAKNEIEATSRQQAGTNTGRVVSITVELLEIYNEQVRDLLAADRSPDGQLINLKLNSNEAVGNTVVTAEKEADVQGILDLAQSRRCVKATKSNAESSRSHLLFTINFDVYHADQVGQGCGSDEDSSSTATKIPIRSGTLHIIDLAGSERVDKSGSHGQLLKEAQHINKSLSALSQVIEALQEKNSHIPYRDSKLTYLLRNSLGGDSKTLAIVCCSPHQSHFNESLSSIRFAAKASKVEMKEESKFNA